MKLMKLKKCHIKFLIFTFILLGIIQGCGSPDGGSTINMRILVPAYFEPTTNGWSLLAAEAAKKSGFIYAIANVYNGPGTDLNNSYLSAINTFRTNSGKCLGYVYTSYGARDISTIKSEINLWFSLYNVDGIFLDEQSDDLEATGYYQQLYQYIKAKNKSYIVIGNPGSNTIEPYIAASGGRSSDVFCVFESTAAKFVTWTPESWYSGYDRSNFGVLIHTAASTVWQQNVDRAANLGMGWIYVTDDTPGNPWDTLPPYFEALCAYVRGK